MLSETDVINMVSRGISTANILKGIHLSMAGRFTRLVRSLASSGVLTVTGGLAADEGLLQAIREELAKAGVNIEMISQGASQINIGILVRDEDAEQTVKLLHDKFFPRSSSSARKPKRAVKKKSRKAGKA